MKLSEFVDLFKKGTKRFHLVGDENCGVIIGLDLEGRLYAVLNGEVLNRVNPQAILEETSRRDYLNPGGDGLWPAPEGTCFGYEYSTGDWRVPPGLTGARYRLIEETANFANVEAEVDLINSLRIGIPTIFGRKVSVESGNKSVKMKVEESITYIGDKPLTANECMIAPWTLCQFDSGEGCEVIFPDAGENTVWDLYDPSDESRFLESNIWHTKTDGAQRYQIGMGKAVDYIEFNDPGKALKVRRTADQLPDNLNYIDIIDAPPDQKPSEKETRFSVYSDTSKFMEIEAAGGCPKEWAPGTVSALTVYTEYFLDE